MNWHLVLVILIGRLMATEARGICVGDQCEDCPPGFQKERDRHGCDTCHCYNPCEYITCPEMRICRLVSTECSEVGCHVLPVCEVEVVIRPSTKKKRRRGGGITLFLGR